MGRRKPEPHIILSPKSDKGKEKLSYHSPRWKYLGEEQHRLIRSKGLCLVCRSPDGKQIILVQKENDPDFDYRLQQ